MSLGVGGSELAILIIALLAAGLVTGFMAGLFGVGGGAILVPVLYETFAALGVDESIRMQMVLGTSLAIIAPTGWRSFVGHRATGAVDMAVLRRLGPWVVLGVIAGVLVAKGSSSATLRWIWVVAGSLLALKLALGRDDWRLGDALPKSWLLEVVAALIGMVSVLMSIGGGSFMVALLVLYGRNILQAVATSSGFGPLIAVPGALGLMWAGWGVPGLPVLSLGYLNLLGALLIVPASVLAAPYGVRVAHGIPRRRLELAFAAFLAAVAIRFLVSLVR